MIYLLFYLISSEIRTYSTPGKHSVSVKAGRYTVHCYGAQGGDWKDGKTGGRGAYAKGTMEIKGNPIQFYGFVGGKGKYTSKGGPNDGGENGGGKSGDDTGKDNDDAVGGGGGATDLRIDDESVGNRIIVAGGGTSWAGQCAGAYGGKYDVVCPTQNNRFAESTDPSDSTGNEKGGDGSNYDKQPGGGGGGGYRGGRGGVGSGSDDGSDCYKSVGCGGSSYISGDPHWKPHDRMSFFARHIAPNYHTGDGLLVIEDDYVCQDGCSACTSATFCTQCSLGFLLNGKCVTDCGNGYAKVGQECRKCRENCAKCEGSPDNCVACKDGYYLHGTECVLRCPSGFARVDGKCVNCKSPCKTCSSPDFCLSCADNRVLYNGECRDGCPEGTVSVNSVCQKYLPFCKTCSNTPTHCTTCLEGYFMHQNTCLSSCPDKMYKSGRDCVPCKDPCESCTSSEKCLTCKEGYFLYQNGCHESCPEGTSPYGVGCMDNQL